MDARAGQWASATEWVGDWVLTARARRDLYLFASADNECLNLVCLNRTSHVNLTYVLVINIQQYRSPI
jgi:hypothetical protein